MARPRKARVEGATRIERVASGEVKPRTNHEAQLGEDLAELRNVASHHREALAAAVEAFKLAYPSEWEANRLCPLQHGLDAMIARLK